MFFNENSKFPPVEFENWFDKMEEWATWYSGDSEALLNYYYYHQEKLFLKTSDIFWARGRDIEVYETAVNCPLASDIAATSSNLLFSEMPLITYDKPSDDKIKTFLEENNAFSLFQEAAEISAALSGVFLKLDKDESISKLSLLSVISPLKAFPTFRYGRLQEVCFYRVVKEVQSKNQIFRLFENRKNNNGSLIIEYKLFKGTEDKIGQEVDLDLLEETKNLINIQLNNMIGLGVVYVPNMKPNRLYPGSDFGINDYSACIPMLDSLDLNWTSLIRDIELGLGQLLIDEELLSRDQNLYTAEGKSYLNSFSKFQKSFIKLNFDKKAMAGDNTKPIEIVQFDMRVTDHLKAIEALTVEIIGRSGYSPNTFGYNIAGTGKDSGTALKIKERKSFFTRGKKENYWVNAIKQLLIQMQYFDNATGSNIYNLIEDLSVNLEDSILVDTKEQSETIKNLDQARAISTYIKVKMQYPSWEETEIEAEVKRINDENSINDIDNVLFDEKKVDKIDEEEEEKIPNKKEI